jgi:hypothetical protein
LGRKTAKSTNEKRKKRFFAKNGKQLLTESSIMQQLFAIFDLEGEASPSLSFVKLNKRMGRNKVPELAEGPLPPLRGHPATPPFVMPRLTGLLPFTKINTDIACGVKNMGASLTMS